MLGGVVGGDTVHSARGKTLTVLMRIWVSVPRDAESLRDTAIKRISSASLEERLAIHWAMSVACCPCHCSVVGDKLSGHALSKGSQVMQRQRV